MKADSRVSQGRSSRDEGNSRVTPARTPPALRGPAGMAARAQAHILMHANLVRPCGSMSVFRADWRRVASACKHALNISPSQGRANVPPPPTHPSSITSFRFSCLLSS